MDFNNSRLQEYLTCRAKFKHRYLVGVVPRKKPTFFVFGEALHKFIEMYYRTKDSKLALLQVKNIFDAVDKTPLNREETHDLECDKMAATGIAEAYPQFYKQDFDEFKNFLTEQKFSIPLGTTGHSYFGTIDALLQDHAGDWWILETKTAAAQSLTEGYFEKVKIDSQVCGYMYGAKRILGSFPRGIIYNVIKKPSIRLKAGESLAAFQRRVFEEYTKFAKEKNYFTREQLILSKHRLDRWTNDILSLVVEIGNKIANKDKLWQMNTSACNANYGTCPYMNACVNNEYNKLIYAKDTSNK